MPEQNDKVNSRPENTEGRSTEEFLRLHMANQKRIYAFILSMVSNWDDADDLMQETTALMWRKFDDYRRGTCFHAWGIQIARYLILDYRKKHRRQGVDFSDEVLDEIFKNAQLVSEASDRRLEALRKCLVKLKDKDREIISLRYDKQQKVKNIAVKLGRSVDGLYKTMSRLHGFLLDCIRIQMKSDQL